MSCRKFAMRWSRASGSTKRRIERAISRGWKPASERPRFVALFPKGRAAR